MDNIIDQSMANMKNIDIKYEEDDPNLNFLSEKYDLYDPECILETIQRKENNIVIQDSEQIIIETCQQKTQKQKTKAYDPQIQEDDQNKDIDDSIDFKSKTTSDEDFQYSLEKNMLIEEYDDDFGREKSSRRQNVGRNKRKYNTRQSKKNKDQNSEDDFSESSSGFYEQRAKRESTKKKRIVLKRGDGGKNQNNKGSCLFEYDPYQNKQRKSAQNILDDLDQLGKKQDNQQLLDVDNLDSKTKKLRNSPNNDQKIKNDLGQNQDRIEGKIDNLTHQNILNNSPKQKENLKQQNENLSKQAGNNEKIIDTTEKPINDLQLPQLNPVLQLQLQQFAQQLQQQQFPNLLQYGQQQNNILNGITNPLLIQGMNQILMQARMNEMLNNIKKEDTAQQFLPHLIPNLIQGGSQSTASKDSNEASTQNQKRGGRRGQDLKQNKNPKDDDSFHLNSPSRKRKYNTRRKIKNYAESPINDDYNEDDIIILKKDKKQPINIDGKECDYQTTVGKDVQDSKQDEQKQQDLKEQNNQFQSDSAKKQDMQFVNQILSKYVKNEDALNQLNQQDNNLQNEKNKQQQRRRPNLARNQQDSDDFNNQHNQIQQSKVGDIPNKNQFNDGVLNDKKQKDVYQNQDQQKYQYNLFNDQGVRYKNDYLQNNMYQKQMNEYDQIIELDENEHQLPKEGHFMYEDKPKCTGQTKYINNEIFIEIIWEQRKNGDIPTPTILSSEVIKYYDKDFLIEFYETRVRKTNEKIAKIQSQQQNQYPPQKPINQAINNSKNAYIDTLRKDIYRNKQGITDQTDSNTKDRYTLKTPEKQQSAYEKYMNEKQSNQKSTEQNRNKNRNKYIDLEQESSDERSNEKKRRQEKEIYLIESSTFNSFTSDSFCIEDPYVKFIQEEGLLPKSVKDIKNKILF